ncbi:hypothetical protein Tco_0007310 [Tanacetum coccineum]
MILGQPVHTDDNVETTKFNRHEIDFERHDKQLSLVVDYFQWLPFCFGSSWSNGPPCCKWSSSISSNNFFPSVLLWLVIIIAVVGVGVTVVVVVAGIVVVVESSSVAMLMASSRVCGLKAVTFPLMLRGWAYAFHQDKASSVRVLVANVTLFSSAHLLRENTDSVRSNQRIRPTAPFVPLK